MSIGASHKRMVCLLAENGYDEKNFITLLRRIAPSFRPEQDSLEFAIQEDKPFYDAKQLGIIELDGTTTTLVAEVKVQEELTARTSKRKQYDLAKRVLKDTGHNGGIFVSSYE